LPGLRAAAAFHPPNKMRFAAPYGPITHPADPIPGALDLGLRDVLRVVEALAVIHDHTTEQITIPNLTTVTRSDAGELIRLARLLHEGSVVVEWHGFDLGLQILEGLPDSITIGGPPASDSFQRPCVVQIDGRDVVLGSVRYDLASVRVESVTPSEDGIVRVRLVPGEDRTATLVYEPPQPD
jgi:hypothetical protein